MNPLVKAAMIFWGVFLIAGLLGGGGPALLEIIWEFTKLLFWPGVIIVAWLVVAGINR